MSKILVWLGMMMSNNDSKSGSKHKAIKRNKIIKQTTNYTNEFNKVTYI